MRPMPTMPRRLPHSLRPHIQVGLLDIELLETAFEQGPRRQCHHHPRQAQRGTARSVEQGDIGQLDGRYQALRAGSDGSDLDGNPQHPCGMRLQLRAKITDSRHNPAMKCPPRDGQQQPEGQQQTQQPPRKTCHSFQQAGGMRGGIDHGGIECGRNYDPQA